MPHGVVPQMGFNQHTFHNTRQVNELYPTAVRSTALGVCSAAARVATLVSAPLPIVMGSTATLALIGTSCAIALPLSWFCLPETLGRALTDAPGAGGGGGDGGEAAARRVSYEADSAAVPPGRSP